MSTDTETRTRILHRLSELEPIDYLTIRKQMIHEFSGSPEKFILETINQYITKEK